jgi:hypothetical protein
MGRNADCHRPRRLTPTHFDRFGRTRTEPDHRPLWRNRCYLADEAAGNSANARGGQGAGKPRCARVLRITAGSSMAAINFRTPPQFGQCGISMSKTRWC